jgi:hypothetical protein
LGRPLFRRRAYACRHPVDLLLPPRVPLDRVHSLRPSTRMVAAEISLPLEFDGTAPDGGRSRLKQKSRRGNRWNSAGACGDD